MFKRSKEINKGIAYNIMLHVKENNAKFVEELGYGKKIIIIKKKEIIN
jgi:hypothetical protein